MAFRFTLEPVLRYRQSVEEAEECRLRELLSRVANCRAQIQRLSSEKTSLQHAIADTLEHLPLCAAELQFRAAELHRLEGVTTRLRSQLDQLLSEVARQSERYQAERQKREILESLRDSQLREFSERQRRREQAKLDELHLLRRGRNWA